MVQVTVIMGDRNRPPYHYGRSQYQRDDRDIRNGRYYEDQSDRYDRMQAPRHPPGIHDGRNGGGYTFRGAADSNNYRPRRPENEFSFRAQGPRYPSPDRHAPTPQRQRQQPHRANDSRRDQGKRGPPGRGNDSRHRGGYRGRVKKPPPSEREILHKTGRASTPEQLFGMNADGQARFTTIISSSDEDSGSESGEVIDLTNDSDEDGDGPRKRVKTNAPAPVEPTAPKWSNPEYLTALPPPENLGAPKKDIVRVIRKAKVEAAPKEDSSNAVKDNIDFISFKFDDDFANSIVIDSDSGGENRPPSNAPLAPAGMKMTGEHVPSTFPPNHSSAPITMHDTVGPPPPPPSDLIMPTDEELIAHYGGDSKGKKRKHEMLSKGVGDIVREWQANQTNPTPWCTVDHTHTGSVGLR